MNPVAWIWHPASSSPQNPHLGATTPPSKPSTMAQDPRTPCYRLFRMAVEKVRRARCVEGEVTLARLMKGMRRLMETPTTNRSYRTAQELILGAVRLSKHLKYNPQIGVERPCSACQIYEDEKDYMTGLQHMLQYCGQAIFCGL